MTTTEALAHADAVFLAERGKATPSLDSELLALYVMVRALLVAVMELQQQ